MFHQLRAERNQYAINPGWGCAVGLDLGTAFWRVVGLDGGKRKAFEGRGERDLGLSPEETVELMGRVVREGSS